MIKLNINFQILLFASLELSQQKETVQEEAAGIDCTE